MNPKVFKTVARVKVSFNAAEYKTFQRAVEVWFGHGDVSGSDKHFFLSVAVHAICAAVVRQEGGMMPLACDLRFETPEETAARLAELKAPEPYSSVFEPCQPLEHGAGGGPGPLVDLTWLRKLYPGRWN
jgi:hypothetical protein